VDEHRVHVDLSKIQVIRDWPALKTMTELCSFLGLAKFYNKFMLWFSHISWALSQVTKGGAKEKFVWDASQQKAFKDLKLCLCSTTILPDLHQTFEIETNALD
jgi:hypothetical protein